MSTQQHTCATQHLQIDGPDCHLRLETSLGRQDKSIRTKKTKFELLNIWEVISEKSTLARMGMSPYLLIDAGHKSSDVTKSL